MKPYLRSALGMAAALSISILFGGCSRENKVAAHLEKAETAFARRDFEVAKIEYVNVLRLETTNTLAQLRLGKIFFEQGQIPQAFALLSRAKEHFPNDAELRTQLAVVHSAGPGESNRIAFIRELDAALQLSPTNESAIVLLGTATRTPEELADSESRLASLRSKHGDHPLYLLVDAAFAIARNDKAKADAFFRQSLERLPDSAVTHQVYANFFALQGRKDETETHLRRAYELSVPHSPARLAWARFLYGSGRHDEARAVLDELNSKAPERTSAWVVRAELALAERKTADAERALTIASAQAPYDVEVLRTIAQLRLAQNRPADAVKELEKAASLRPDSESLQFQLARVYLAAEDPARATAALEKAIQLRPDFSPASLLLGQLQIRRGAREEAITTFRESIRQNPSFESAYLQLARAYSASGRPEDAFNALQVARSRFTNSFETPLEQGLALRQLGRTADAAKAFEESLQRSPTNHFAALEQLVLLDVAATNYSRAQQRLSQRLAQQPNEHLLWLVQCEVFLHQGNLADAENAARKATELAPNAPQGLMSLARVLARNPARQKDALQELDTLVAKNTNNLEALILSAGLLQKTKDYPRAAERYQQAIAAAPRNAYLHNNLAYLQAEHLKRLDDGLASATRARELAPDDPAIADTLGWIHFRRRSYEDALRFLLEASAKLNAQPEVLHHLGLAHYMMGHESEALAALTKANASPLAFDARDEVSEYLAILNSDASATNDAQLSLLEQRRRDHPTDVIALSRIASTLAARGDSQKARDAYEEALKITPRSGLLLSRLATLYAEKLNDPTRASELIRTARSAAPNDPEVAYAHGKISVLNGDFLSATASLEEAARRLTNRTEVSSDLAWALLGQGRTDDAVSALRTAAAGASPTAMASRESLSLLEIARKPANTPQNVALIDAALRKNPNQPVALLAYASLAQTQKRPADAIKACTQILAVTPNWTPALRTLALLLADEPVDDAKGLDAATRARRILPTDDALTAALGKLTARKGDHRLALQLLTDAARSQTTDPSLHYHLGLVQQALGLTADARKSFQTALAQSPSAWTAAEARKRLESIPAQ